MRGFETAAHDGLTHVMDKGLGPRAWEDVLETCGDYISIVKLGWGTAFVTPNLERKLAVLRAATKPVGRCRISFFPARGTMTASPPVRGIALASPSSATAGAPSAFKWRTFTTARSPPTVVATDASTKARVSARKPTKLPSSLPACANSRSGRAATETTPPTIRSRAHPGSRPTAPTCRGRKQLRGSPAPVVPPRCSRTQPGSLRSSPPRRWNR